uniref:Uncharacterized protein n=1 Tax=Mycena chlorophos TaxID=658473 RepID=A0ABQ0LB41_MYCCL|nr:predicted protein [Mycena chlorophos]
MRRGPPRWRRPQAPQWVIAEKQSALRVLRLASNSHVRAIPRPWPSAFSRSRLTAAGRAARLKLAGLAVAPLSQGTGRVRTHPELGDDTGRDNTDKRHIRIVNTHSPSSHRTPIQRARARRSTLGRSSMNILKNEGLGTSVGRQGDCSAARVCAGTRCASPKCSRDSLGRYPAPNALPFETDFPRRRHWWWPRSRSESASQLRPTFTFVFPSAAAVAYPILEPLSALRLGVKDEVKPSRCMLHVVAWMCS